MRGVEAALFTDFMDGFSCLVCVGATMAIRFIQSIRQ